MAKKTEDVKLGACNVFYDGQDLGYTSGGVEVQIETDTKEITVDQLGNTKLSEFIQGRNCTIKVPMAESVLENLMKILPGATLSDNGEQLTITTGMGENLIDYSRELKLVPLNESDLTIVIPKAATPGSFNLTYKHDEMRVYEAEFKSYPDDGVVGYIQKTHIPEIKIGTVSVTSDKSLPSENDKVTLTVQTGVVDPATAVVTYQWYRDGVAIIGEKQNKFSFTFVNAIEADRVYSCEVKAKADGYKDAIGKASIKIPRARGPIVNP